jgi:hypothetical protein
MCIEMIEYFVLRVSKVSREKEKKERQKEGEEKATRSSSLGFDTLNNFFCLL